MTYHIMTYILYIMTYMFTYILCILSVWLYIFGWSTVAKGSDRVASRSGARYRHWHSSGRHSGSERHGLRRRLRFGARHDRPRRPEQGEDGRPALEPRQGL